MGQKGSEFALCLNSANRDVEAHPEPNDFTLDLKDRYLVQGRRPGPRTVHESQRTHPHRGALYLEEFWPSINQK